MDDGRLEGCSEGTKVGFLVGVATVALTVGDLVGVLDFETVPLTVGALSK